MSRSRLWNVVAGALLTAILGACATNPVTGGMKSRSSRPRRSWKSAGRAMRPVIAEYGLYDDAALSAYVNATGQKVAHVSHLPDLEWHFTILDDPTVNAFAMPGGYIYITRGLLAVPELRGAARRRAGP